MAISVNLYHDTRSAKGGSARTCRDSAQEYAIKIALTKDSSTTYLPTGVKVRAGHWRNRQVVGRPDKMTLNTSLEKQKADVMAIIRDNRVACRYADMSVSEIKKDILKRLAGVKVEVKMPLFLKLFDSFAEKRRSERTKEIYRASARKIRKLIPDSELLTVDDITLDWLEEYEDTLISRGNNPATRSIEFRNIRAVVKYALKHKIIRDNPFEGFTIPEGRSPNRALTVTELRSFINAEMEPWEQKYMDFFLLSFLLLGINTEDLLHLDGIQEGRINYIRAKTHTDMSVKVEPEALDIINKYKGGKHLLNVLDTYSNTHNWTSKVDAVLKDIAKRNGLPPITMYWARHTWATLANVDLRIELSTVSDALGHQPEKKVTLIYIKKKDYTKVDEANRKVIDYVLNK